MFLNIIYSQQDQGFHAVPQDQPFQRAPEVPQVQFSQQAPLLQLLPGKHRFKIFTQLLGSQVSDIFVNIVPFLHPCAPIHTKA